MVKKQFVLNLPLEGGPDNREDLILRSMLSDKQHFLRYLLLLLSEGNDLTGMAQTIHALGETGRANQSLYLDELPLLEELVRAYSRDPSKMERVGRLVADLMKTPAGREVLPTGFAEVWQTFAQAMVEQTKARRIS